MPLQSVRGSGGQYATGKGVQWVGLEILANNINKRGKSLNASRRRTIDKMSAEVLAWMQENAPWEDVTGMAREKLRCDPVHDERNETSTLYLGHGVDYGDYLETVGGGVHAIIMPTIVHFQHIVMGRVKENDEISGILGSMA